MKYPDIYKTKEPPDVLKQTHGNSYNVCCERSVLYIYCLKTVTPRVRDPSPHVTIIPQSFAHNRIIISQLNKEVNDIIIYI